MISTPGDAPRAAGPVAAHQLAVLVERDEIDLVDRLARARHEHQQHRRRAVERAAGELRLHVLGDEEAVVEHRAERRPQPRQRGRQHPPHAFGHLRQLARRLEAGEHVDRGMRIDRVGVKEIGSAEHVEHGRAAPCTCSAAQVLTFASWRFSRSFQVLSKARACACQPASLVQPRAVISPPAPARRDSARHRWPPRPAQQPASKEPSSSAADKQPGGAGADDQFEHLLPSVAFAAPFRGGRARRPTDRGSFIPWLPS